MDLPSQPPTAAAAATGGTAGVRVALGASSPIDDRHVEVFEPIATPAEVRAELPATEAHHEVVRRARDAIAAAMRGEDDRMVVVVGPCSIHDASLAREYAERLAPVARELADDLVIVMRTYFEKPRTSIG
jgi:3-deoxy-7-phosphoheptulonate synthase